MIRKEKFKLWKRARRDQALKRWGWTAQEIAADHIREQNKGLNHWMIGRFFKN